MRVNKAIWWTAGAAVATVIIFLLGQAGPAGLSGLNGPAGWAWPRDILDWRWEILLFAGLFTWVLLTVCVLIPARWPWMNRLAGGLDKGYGLHKVLGVAALVTVFLHWNAVQSWRWLAGWEQLSGSDLMLEVLGRLGSGGAFPLDPLSRLGGGAAFFIMAALVLTALVKRIPYHVFSYIHKLAPAVYLLGSIHVLNRIPSDWWLTPAAYILVALTALGIWASITALIQGIGRKRKSKARIQAISREEDTLDLTLEPEQAFPHRAGQFAFVNFQGPAHESHPFSMASHNPERVRFLIKELGDATKRLQDTLKTGQTLELEGPYGRFDFESSEPRQAWVAGGIGITPFMARLEELAARQAEAGQVDLWYSVSTEEEAKFPAGLAELCQRAGVNLHQVVSERDETLQAEDVAARLGDLKACSVWFCGPDGFKDDLQRGLLAKGLPAGCFHFERFEFR